MIMVCSVCVCICVCVRARTRACMRACSVLVRVVLFFPCFIMVIITLTWMFCKIVSI